MNDTSSSAGGVDITSIGGAAFDVFIKAPHSVASKDGEDFIQYPLGGKIKVESVIQSCGGGATNTSVGFSRLGLSARFCGVIGDDEWGQGIQEALKKEGVDTSTAIIVEDEVSSFSIILVDPDSGKRTILYSPNVNAHLCDPVLPKELLTKSPWIFLNHLTDVSCVILDDVCEIVCNPEVKLAWNPGGSQVREGFDAPVVKDLLADTDILFLNSEEAKKFTRSKTIEDALKIGTQNGAKIMCVTDGARGAYLSDGKTVYSCTQVPLVEVVDTTGAGDAFATGVTWAIINGMPLQDALKAGMISSASVISKIGTQAGLLTEGEMREKLSSINLQIKC